MLAAKFHRPTRHHHRTMKRNMHTPQNHASLRLRQHPKPVMPMH